MKVQEMILRAMAKSVTWWQAGEIIGIGDRSMRRWRERYDVHGYEGLFDWGQGQPAPKRVPMATVEQVLGLCLERLMEFSRLKLMTAAKLSPQPLTESCVMSGSGH